MPTFNYEGRDKAGKKISASLKTENFEALMIFFKERGITPIKINEAKIYRRFPNFLRLMFKERITKKALLNFTRQMAALLAAGMPIIKAVKQSAYSTKNKYMQQLLFDLVDGLESGNSFIQSLQKHAEIFPATFLTIIEVAENTGQLDIAFQHLSEFLEKRLVNHQRLVSVIRYPIIVILTALLALAIINIFVIPRFVEMFQNFKGQLPIPTIVLMNIAMFIANNWVVIVIALILIAIGWHYWLKVPKYRLLWDQYKLKIPIIGNLQKQIILTQFTWTFGMILRSDVPILKGLTMIGNLTENQYITNKIWAIRDRIDQGEKFTDAVSKSGLFDDNAMQLIEVGDETGKLEEMFTKVAAIYEAEVDYAIKNMNDLLEPILLMIIGAMVVVLALGVYLPMWDIIKTFK
jgi:MSHA biogenesis protein MshG